MNVSVEKIRVWLLVGAALLVTVIAVFLGYAHYRAHRFLNGLPGRMGVDIQQETNGFTYSQSVKGRTVYTIHAAKAVKRLDGKVTLNDVGIVLYGSGTGNTDRVDRIYGKEFEYDQAEGVIRAMGEVHIDLQAPAPVGASAKAEYAKGHEVSPASHEDERLIHVKTSGLVFLQKLGVAATDQDLEFEFNGMTGHAHGADYSSDTGLLVLQSAVKVNGLKDGRPTVLTASRAELDRQKQRVFLNHAEYTVIGSDADARIARAERVTAYLRHEGSVEHAVAEGGVALTDTVGTATAERGEARLNDQNQLQGATLSGSVRFGSSDPLRQLQGEGQEGRAYFSKMGALNRIALTGSVHVHERARASAEALWSERDLSSKELELTMSPGVAAPGAASQANATRAQLRGARATGDARLVIVNPPAVVAKPGHHGATTSALSGDVLTADFLTRDGGTHVKTVHGAGHTVLRRVSDTGAVETSSGDVLDASFHAVGGARRSATDAREGMKNAGMRQGADEIASAVQQGHVVMTNLPALKPGDGEPAKGTPESAIEAEQRATAEKATYDGFTENTTLTGAVQISNAVSVLSAERVVMDQATGNAVADGAVKASYVQTSQPSGAGRSPEMVHVLAVRGEFKHETGIALFYGAAGKPARLWQGASQVEAPKLRFEQKERRLLATSEGPGLAVHATFVSGGQGVAANRPAVSGASGTLNAAGRAPAGRQPRPVRVVSHAMTYSDVARRADFTGGVQVEDEDGMMRSQQAVVYLRGANAARPAAIGKTPGTATQATGEEAFLGGSVDHVVALGQVSLVQPGRKATGDQVVYTAADGLFVLTGLPGLPPKMIDETRGAITGAVMSFHAGDNSVVVSNGPDGASGERVRTETRVKQ